MAQRAYVRGSYLPFEEDETHEFKGHREIAPEDTPPWAFSHPHETRSRQAISRNLNAFLNTGRGGVVYCGVDDRGRVMGLHLTRYQKDHVLLSVRCLLLRYRPAVPSGRSRVTFVPVVSEADVGNPPAEFTYDVKRRSKQHLVATSDYCWCDADARARSVSGVIPLSYVIEIEILPWPDRDKALHPFYLTESGKCYVRRQASILPLTAADCIRITRHEAAALSRRQSEQMALSSQRDVAALQARLDSGQLWPAAVSGCRCPAGSDAPSSLVGAAGGSVRVGREGEEASDGEVRELVQNCGSDMGHAQSSSDDGGLSRQSSVDTGTPQFSSSTARHSHNPSLSTCSSFSDSGLSLSCPSDTSLSDKTVFDTSENGSSSENGVTSHSDDGASSTANSVTPNPSSSELPQSMDLASGVGASSELLHGVISARLPSPPPRQSSPDSTALASAAGATTSDSDRAPGGGEPDVSLSVAGDVSVMDLRDSGTEMSLLVPEAAPDEALVELGSGVAGSKGLSMSSSGLGVDMLAYGAKQGADEVQMANQSFSGTSLADGNSGLPIGDTIDQGFAGTVLSIIPPDVSLLELGSAAEQSALEPDTSCATLMTAAAPPSFSTPAESDSAVTMEPESDCVGEESRSPVPESPLGPHSTCGPPAGDGGPSVARQPLRGGWRAKLEALRTPHRGTQRLSPSIRGRGTALESASKMLNPMEKSSEVAKEVSETCEVVNSSGTCGTPGLGSDAAADCELDSDDSDDSWGVEFPPECRRVASLSDSATVG